MKILHVINSLSTGGAEKLLLETIPLYQEKELSVDLYTLKDVNSPFLDALQSKSTGRILNSGLCSLYSPLHIWRLKKYLSQYDIIHVHLFPALYWVAISKILFLSNVRLVYTEHSTYNNRRKKAFKVIERIIYKQYAKIIAITEEVLDNSIKHLSINRNRFTVINNGVDVERVINEVNNAKSPFSNTVDFIITQVSRFSYPKDQFTLIKSLRHLPKNTGVALIGEGENKAECQQLVENLNLQNRVHFYGNRMDVPKLLKASDIVVLSSHYEGLSLSCIEGLASGRPFIATDVQGLRDIVKGAGLLFPQGDDLCLAQIIKNLMDDKTLYNEVVDACIKRSREYDIKQMVAAYIQLYKSILNEA